MTTAGWKMISRTVPATILASLLIAGLARAHAFIEESVPADGAALAEPPAKVTIRYAEPVEARLSTLKLVDAEGRPVPDTRQASEGNRVLVLELPRLQPGKYAVESRAVARDGHTSNETIRFSVSAPASAEEPAETDPAAAPSRTGEPAPPAGRGGTGGSAAAILLAALAGGALILALARRKKG